MSKTREVQVNERGRRIGESHPRAKLTDHEIDLMRELYEELRAEGMKNREAAKVCSEKFDQHERSVRKIVHCERRAQTAARAKRVKTPA